jgi:hypothetical protein
MFAQNMHKVCTKYAQFAQPTGQLFKTTAQLVKCANFVHTLCTLCANIVQTVHMLCKLCVNCANLVKKKCLLMTYDESLLQSLHKKSSWPCFLISCSNTGPKWHCPKTGTVLLASRRQEGASIKKTKGSLADTLQYSIWRRAQHPGRLTHSFHGGGNHSHGYTSLGKKIGIRKASWRLCLPRLSWVALH